MRFLKEYISAAVLLAASGMNAQDFNPTVEVTRRYRGSMDDVSKPVLEMVIPDSVLQFNLNFDYSVFEKPYKGTYEFRPLLMNMTLNPLQDEPGKLYLRAGAGYSLHPELDFVWTPFSTGKARISIYAGHASYVGKYRSLGLDAGTSTPEGSAVPSEIKADGGSFSGYDMLSRAGVQGAYDWEKGMVFFDAGYYGTALKDTVLSRGYDAVDLSFGVSSKERIETHFVYDVRLDYRYAEDKLVYPAAGDRYLTGHDFSVTSSLGQSFRSGHSFLIDIDYDMAYYGAAFRSFAGSASFTPRYLFRKNRWNINAGARVALLFRDAADGVPVQMNAHKGQVVYPDVKVSFSAIRKWLDLYLAFDGGPDINKYSSVLSSNRHVHPFYNAGGTALLDNTVERVSAKLGITGNIASRLTYDLSAGYRNFSNAPLESVTVPAMAGVALPGLAYTPYQTFFSELDFTWKSQDVKAEGFFRYQTTDLGARQAAVFAPAVFTGYVSAMYNWKGRIYAGADCAFSSSRAGTVTYLSGKNAFDAVVPAWADLGIALEYAVTRKFSVWLRAGNLLDMTIQRIPMYAESGIHFTAGICLNL